MELDERMKWRPAVLGCVVVGAVLAAATDSQFRGKAQGSNHAEAWAEQTEEMAAAGMLTGTTGVATTEEETEPTKPGIVMGTRPTTEPSRTGTTGPTEVLSAQTDQTEQAVQPALEKPTAPPKEVLKDPTQKPDGEIAERAPEAIPHEKIVQPGEASMQTEELQYGDTQNGKIYVPGFGWIDEIGGGQGTVVEDMYENGNKIDITN